MSKEWLILPCAPTAPHLQRLCTFTLKYRKPDLLPSPRPSFFSRSPWFFSRTVMSLQAGLHGFLLSHLSAQAIPLAHPAHTPAFWRCSSPARWMPTPDGHHLSRTRRQLPDRPLLLSRAPHMPFQTPLKCCFRARRVGTGTVDVMASYNREGDCSYLKATLSPVLQGPWSRVRTLCLAHGGPQDLIPVEKARGSGTNGAVNHHHSSHCRVPAPGRALHTFCLI